ncbi:Protein of unknown function [Bacillus toyonensis]|nr:Protein of unknown function [Bacillus toyonensis]
MALLSTVQIMGREVVRALVRQMI